MDELSTHWLCRRDLQQVLDIERRVFDEPLSEYELIQLLERWDTMGMVAERSHRVIAYALICYAGHYLHITRLAAHPYLGGDAETNLVSAIQLKGETRKRIAVVAHSLVTDYQRCEFWSEHGFYVVAVDDDDVIEFHWPCEKASRVVEEAFWTGRVLYT